MENSKVSSRFGLGKSPMLVILVIILVAVIVGVVNYGNNIENTDLSAGARASKVSDAVILKEEIDPKVLAEAIASAPEDAETVTVMSKSGTMVTQAVLKKMLIMGGGTFQKTGGFLEGLNDVWSTNDGLVWNNLVPNGTLAGWFPRYSPTSFYFKGKIYLIGGFTNSGVYNEIWTSIDGVQWLQQVGAPWTHPYGKSFVQFNNKIWAIGGNTNMGSGTNDVWSFNGTMWSQEPNAPWSGRAFTGLVVYNQKIYLIGGYDNVNGSALNDVWSFNGTTWSQESQMPTSTFFNQSKTPQVFQNKIWVLGGLDGNINGQISNQVLSFDGTTWVTHSPAPWTPRNQHLTFVFKNKLFIAGGNDSLSNNNTLNDVWSFNGTAWSQKPNAPWISRFLSTAVKVPVNFGVFLPGCFSYLGYSTTTGLPCYIETKPATNITSTSASLQGYLYSNTPALITWKITPLSTGSIPVYTATTTGPLNPGNITGLTPNTSYYFQACVKTSTQMFCSGGLNFTTLP